MGNTHSEAPIQRERDLPPQAVEVLRKDWEDEKTSRKSNSSNKEEQQRVSFSLACSPSSGLESQRARDTIPQASAHGNQEPASAAILDARVKPNQGKKRKIAKARKWTPVQVTSQDAMGVVDKLAAERLHSSVRTEQGRARSPKAIEGLAVAAPALGFCRQEKELSSKSQVQPNTGNKDQPNQGASDLASKGREQGTGTGAGTTTHHRGQGELVEGALLPLPPPSQGAATAKRVQLACALQGRQGKPGKTQGQNPQAPINGKESPSKLIKLSATKSPPGPQGTGPGASDKMELPASRAKPSDALPVKQAPAGGEPSERAAEPGAGGSPKRQGQGAPACQLDKGSPRAKAALASSKRALGQDGDLAPPVPAGLPKAQSFLNKWGAHAEKELSSADHSQLPVDLPPLPPGARAAAPHRNKHGALADISYAEVLKQVPMLRISQDAKCPTSEAREAAEVAVLDPNGAKELGDAAVTQDGASAALKKKLPFYEQLIASLKSQTQKQKGAKPQRQTLTQEQSQPQPARGDSALEAPIVARVSPGPLLLPSPQAQPPAGSPKTLPLLSPASFQFEAPEPSARVKADPKFTQWFQSQQQPIFQFQSKAGRRASPQEQVRANPSVSLGPLCQTAQQPAPVRGTVPQLNTSVQLQSQSWLNHQIEAQCRLQLHPQTQPWSISMGTPPSMYTQPQLNTQPALGNLASDQLPIWPLLQSQTQAQAKFSAVTHLQCQQYPKPAIQTPLHLQISCNIQQPLAVVPPPPLPVQVKLELPQQPKQIQVQNQAQSQATAKAQHQPESKGSSKPAAPAPAQLKVAPKPQRQDQLPPKASLQTSAKAKVQAQAKGRKAQSSLPSQSPLQRQEPVQVQAESEPAAKGQSPVQRPTGRWSAFQIDKTCTRKCHCRHREEKGTSHLPRNIANW